MVIGGFGNFNLSSLVDIFWWLFELVFLFQVRLVLEA